MKRLIGLVCIFILLTSVGCSQEELKLGIRGEITSISSDNSGRLTGILVEGTIEKDTQYDKASVSINEKTKIYKNSTKETVERSTLKKGTKVEIIFEGPVRESYPVQADAKIIRIIN